MGGSADFILPTLVVGGHGVIAGLANLAPRTCVRVMQLYEQGKLAEAQKLQAVLARGDWVAIKGGFVAVKCGLDMFCGYGGSPSGKTSPSSWRSREVWNSFLSLPLVSWRRGSYHPSPPEGMKSNLSVSYSYLTIETKVPKNSS